MNKKGQKLLHLLEGERGFVAVLITEVIVHPEVRLSAELVSGFAVWDALDHATLRERRSVNKKNLITELKFDVL